jgi:hypothetical protein
MKTQKLYSLKQQLLQPTDIKNGLDYFAVTSMNIAHCSQLKTAGFRSKACHLHCLGNISTVLKKLKFK